jgi:hypothetical protein
MSKIKKIKDREDLKKLENLDTLYWENKSVNFNKINNNNLNYAKFSTNEGK